MLKRNVAGFEKYFLTIEEWLEKPINPVLGNMPFIIDAEDGIGKKSLLVKWMEFHQSNKSKKSVLLTLTSATPTL